MKSIVKNAKDKVFYAKCPKCSTEFIYSIDDVHFDRQAFAERSTPLVSCPECGDIGVAKLLTQDEYENTHVDWGFSMMAFILGSLFGKNN